MKNDFRVASLGPCQFDSPLDRAVFVDAHAGVLVDATARSCRTCKGEPEVLEQAGPRRKIFFAPRQTRAAIVTCGGLCPGLNDVIRALTMVLWYRYGVRHVLGLKDGYEGLVEATGNRPIQLTPDIVEDIHQDGGSILRTSRGAQPVPVMVDFLAKNRINILFTIGGDGTHRGSLAIAAEIRRRNLSIAVVGIPKTIDNDISFTERTFGFETAVAMSRTPITCAHMEAKGVRNGVSIVRLMGRESGFVAAYATLASSDVNLVLVPEVPFVMDKVCAFLKDRLRRKSHAVIVAAEGAGQELVPTPGVDASGNRKLGDIGTFLKTAITDYFREAPHPATVRYIDPSYTIRSAPAIADDSVFCFQLAENAVHAAMSGRTAVLAGSWNGHFVHIPMEKAVHTRKKIDPEGLLWQSVLDNTGQPATLA